MRNIDFTGKRKGLLVAISCEKGSYWKCKCDCGNEKVIRFSGSSAISCGCRHTPNDQIYVEQVKNRLKNNSIITSEDCWLWNKTRDGGGYGTTTYRQKSGRRVHRLTWMLYFGEIPKNLCVCHTCDNRSCCNPEHLFLGTNKENSKDMVIKGRQAKGSKGGSSKLNEDQVIQIRELYEVGNITQVQLGVKFGIRQTKISEIVNRKTWKHI